MDDIEKLKKQVKQKPDSILLVMKLAEALRAAGKHRDAAITLAAGLKLKPKFIKARKLLGEVCFEAGKFDLAEKEFRRILSVMPEDIDALLMLGDSFLKQGKKKEAFNAYKKVLKIDPYEKRATRNLERLKGGKGAEVADTVTKGAGAAEPKEIESPLAQAEAEGAEEMPGDMEEDATMVMEAPEFGGPPEAAEVPEAVTLEPEAPAPPAVESPFDAEEEAGGAEGMPGEPEEDSTMVMEAPEFGRTPVMPDTEGAEAPQDPLAETVLETPFDEEQEEEGAGAAEAGEEPEELEEDATMVMAAPIFDMDTGPGMDEPSEFESDAGAPVEHFDAEAVPEVPETVTLEPDAGAAVEHFEPDTSEVEGEEPEELEEDATMVMAAPIFDMDTGSGMDEPSEFESDAGAPVEHLVPEEVEAAGDETASYDSVAGAEVEHAEADMAPVTHTEADTEADIEAAPDLEEAAAFEEAPSADEAPSEEEAVVYEEEDADSTMVMEAPVFDIDTGPDIEAAPAEDLAPAFAPPSESAEAAEAVEMETPDDGFEDDAFAGYDENPDGDMIIGGIDMDMDMEVEADEDESAGFGADEFLSSEGGGGLEPGAMDMAEDVPMDHFEVGEIELGEEEEYESASDLEHAAERVAEEVFVEKMDEDDTMVMEAPTFDEPAAYEEAVEAEPAMEVEEDEGMTMEVAPPAFEEAAVEVEAEPVVEVEEEEEEEAAPAFQEPDPEALRQADELIEKGQFVEAMEVYNKILEQAPDYGPVLQRVQELRLLMKVQGKGSALVEHGLGKFLSAIQRRRDEFYANP